MGGGLKRRLCIAALLIPVVLLLLSLDGVQAAQRRSNRRPRQQENEALLSDDSLVVAGQLLPAVQKFSMNGDNLKKVWLALKEAIDVKEFALLTLFGWTLVPLAKVLHGVYTSIVDRMKSDEDDTSSKEDTEMGFTDSYLYHSAQDVSNVAQIGALVYGVDCFMVTLSALGFQTHRAGLSKKVAQISYTIWAGLRLARLKGYLLMKRFQNDLDSVVRTRLYDRILNIVIGITTSAIVFDFMDLNLGTTLKSLLSFGGVGALVLSLSSKDLASQLVSGIALSTGDRFIEGDEIQLGDGQAGIVEKIGLSFTDLRGYDEITTRIPNSQLSAQRVRNCMSLFFLLFLGALFASLDTVTHLSSYFIIKVSRVTKSQVTQTLWFSYKDIDKMPAVMEAIKEEVLSECGEFAITDGSRPFRAHWRGYANDHLEIGKYL